MEPADYNNIPRETIMVIGNMDSFSEFVAMGATDNAITRLIDWFPAKKEYTNKIVEKYIFKHISSLAQVIKEESNKFMTETTETDSEAYCFETDADEIKENKITWKLKRGDIDRIMVTASNHLLYSILMSMTDDKILKFCWCPESNNFMWIVRQLNEKVHDESKKVSKKTRKKK